MSEHTKTKSTARDPKWEPVCTFERMLYGRTVDAGAIPQNRGGVVYLRSLGQSYTEMTAAEARDLAQGLLKAADEADTRWPDSVWPGSKPARDYAPGNTNQGHPRGADTGVFNGDRTNIGDGDGT